MAVTQTPTGQVGCVPADVDGVGDDVPETQLWQGAKHKRALLQGIDDIVEAGHHHHHPDACRASSADIDAGDDAAVTS